MPPDNKAPNGTSASIWPRTDWLKHILQGLDGIAFAAGKARFLAVFRHFSQRPIGLGHGIGLADAHGDRRCLRKLMNALPN